MSIKLFREVEELKIKQKALDQKLDKLGKKIHDLTKALSGLERQERTISDETVVPRVALPDSLEELGIGQQPKGGLNDGTDLTT